MKYMLGYCGVECSKCTAYIATINNDDELRRRYAAEQSEFFGMEILPEQINCVGCLEDGVHLAIAACVKSGAAAGNGGLRHVLNVVNMSVKI